MGEWVREKENRARRVYWWGDMPWGNRGMSIYGIATASTFTVYLERARGGLEDARILWSDGCGTLGNAQRACDEAFVLLAATVKDAAEGV